MAARSRLARDIQVAALVVAIGASAMLSSGCVQMINYDRAGAVAFAQRYWNSYPTGGETGEPSYTYRPFGSDCTNFLSYSIRFGGGVSKYGDWYLEPDPFGGRNYTKSWTIAYNFWTYWTGRGALDNTWFLSSGARPWYYYAGGSVGDVIEVEE